MTYDSTAETTHHIERVRHFLDACAADLRERADLHDASKLEDPEKAIFDEWTPRLREVEYGSEEYKGMLEAIKPALEHHYAVNDHHPEHFANGVKDMNLLQVVEMLCDWRAATERMQNGDIRKSIEINAERFGYSEEFKRLLLNTVPFLEAQDA